MWGSSLPNRFFQDLEITFSFFYSLLFLIFTVFYPYCFTLSFTFFYPLQSLIHPPISQFYLTDSYINYYQSYIQCWSMLIIQFLQIQLLANHNHILYMKNYSIFLYLRKQTSRIIVESDTYFKVF